MYFKSYPYLQQVYRNYSDELERQQRQDFLSEIDRFVNQRQYVKITLLDWDENPLKEIQGILSGGSITKDANSAVRRTASFSAILSGGTYDINNMEMDFGINRKIYLEIGVKNDSYMWKEFPILWFPQGMFIIANFSMSTSATSGVSISITCKDKMCLLNGDLGGLFPATTILDVEDTQDNHGQYVEKKVRIHDLIQELVHHFGQESLNNIVIEGVDEVIRRVMKWTGDNPLYMAAIPNPDNPSAKPTNLVSTDKTRLRGQIGGNTQNADQYISQYENGDDVGYIYEDFYYVGDLTANAGQNICQILDTIKNYLGNYEYFYDEYGVFHFQEIKNYLNNTQGKMLINDMTKNDYLVDTTLGKDLYSFDSDRNLISMTVNPQYLNIKNDFIVLGQREGADGQSAGVVMYHIAIDEKPREYTERESFVVYKDPESGVQKGAIVQWVENNAFPDPGNFNIIYGNAAEKDTATGGSPALVYWDNEYKPVEIVRYFKTYTPKDWRTELYLQGLAARNLATDANYYWLELEAFWPVMYDLVNQKFFQEESQTDDETGQTQYYTKASALTHGDYYLDFIDPSDTSLGKYSVKAIGRRQFVNNNKDVNCLFMPEIPNKVFLSAGWNQNYYTSEGEYAQWMALRDDEMVQVEPGVFDALVTGGQRNAAYDEIKYDITKHTIYQSTISMTAIPAFYMQPNTRITVADKTTNTYGSYVITNISITLGPGSPMTVSAHEAFERY